MVILFIISICIIYLDRLMGGGGTEDAGGGAGEDRPAGGYIIIIVIWGRQIWGQPPEIPQPQ